MLYSSRSTIPYGEPNRGVPKIDGGGRLWYKHVGIYVYRRSFLLHYPTLERSPLEEAEGLEQLRILEHGYRIRVYATEWETLGIDTQEDFLGSKKAMDG